LAIRTEPSSNRQTTSVNVPPISTPISPRIVSRTLL
jgi:hypothetical protein